MEAVLTYRGRSITAADIEFIRELIARRPEASRRALSQEFARAKGWVQPNGHLSDLVCRSLMLLLHRSGHIELPKVRCTPPNPLAKRARPALVQVDTTPVCTTLAEMGPLTFRQVRRTAEEPLFNGLMEMHHYLGYVQPVGEHLKYLVWMGDRPVACFAWSSAPRHLGPRDRYIGWSKAARRKNVHLVSYNTRFLVLPWIQVPHLASHLLGRMVRVLSGDWERQYGHPIYFVETFVDSERFKGTCYRAANWVWLGRTTGRGKDDLTHRPNRPIKDVLGYPLTRHFRKQLCGEK